jgi:hypothetical protein
MDDVSVHYQRRKPHVPDTSLPQHVRTPGDHLQPTVLISVPFRQYGGDASMGALFSQPSMTLFLSHERTTDFRILPSFLGRPPSGSHSRTRSDSTSRAPFLKYRNPASSKGFGPQRSEPALRDHRRGRGTRWALRVGCCRDRRAPATKRRRGDSIAQD